MRIAIIVLLIVAVMAGAVAVYLVTTTPKTAAPLTFPLSQTNRSLLARVPADADAFGLVPAAAAFQAKLLANSVTREPAEEWMSAQPMPKPWLLGGASVLVWRREKHTSYAITLDAVRAVLARGWTSVAANGDARWEGTTLFINAPVAAPIDPHTLDDLLQMAAGLPSGDVFAVQRDRSRGAYPPIGRPAVTSLKVTPGEITLVSRSRSTVIATATAPLAARFPAGAMFSIAFAQPPDALRDLRRLLGADIQDLAGSGGIIDVYDVDAGTLLPRPKGVIVLPPTTEARAALARVGNVAQLIGETRDSGSELLMSFDHESISRYSSDHFVAAAWPANHWSLRADAPRLLPILEKLSDNPGLRFAAPRIHRSARDLRRWIGPLKNAGAVEAADSDVAGAEELRVRITSK